MKLAITHRCKNVAFPLIASGLYGYPKDKVLKEATDVLNKFLKNYEMDVYIVVYDKTAYSISKELFDDVSSFIDNFYVEMNSDVLDNFREEDVFASYQEKRIARDRTAFRDETIQERKIEASICCNSLPFKSNRLDKMLKEMDKGFAETLFDYIDKKGLTDVEAYKRANVSRKTFSKIKCDKSYKPSKITAISFAVGLHLDLEETRHLLSTAGIALSHSDKFDVIIEYFIMSGKYETIHDVNEVLYQFDQLLLGV